ncbi:MAG TPA: PadR family transcriptional regulator, partial [Pseudomonas sp.]|nr:PadR family transcriptional regulator [Pseudomonas sp.]
LHMHHGRWTPEEIERVRDLLNVTAKAIAGGPHAPDQESVDE